MIAVPRARCPESWQSSRAILRGGSLPPGLRRGRHNDIEGTPRRPGRWSVTLEFTGIRCRGKRYPDQNVNVDFNIKGLAPRRVN